jgi:hypothetical protein
MNPIRHTPLRKFSDELQKNTTGYPKTIYDDGDTKFQVWNFGNSFLVLLIKNSIIPKDAELLSEIWPHGERRVSFRPPSQMNPNISDILEMCAFDSQECFSETDEWLMVSLEDEIAMDIGRQLEEYGVGYKKEIYDQFLKDRGAELDAMDRDYYRTHATRPVHPNIAILQEKVSTLEATIEHAIEVLEVDEDDRESYEEAVETLRDSDGYFFEELYQIKEETPKTGGTAAEEDAMADIDRRIEELKRRMRHKLEEMGYQGAQD